MITVLDVVVLAGEALAVVLILAVLGRVVLASIGRVYRRHRSRLPPGIYTHITRDSTTPNLDNGDGTVTLLPNRQLAAPRDAIYFYGPSASHRGARYNHAPLAAGRPLWTEIGIDGEDLIAASPKGSTVRRRPWDDAYAVHTHAPLTVRARLRSGERITDYKPRATR